MQARKKSVMWERRLSTIYHCCADMPWEESCAENPNIGTSIFAAVISDLVWGTFQTQGAHNEGLASHEQPAVKLKGHVNCWYPNRIQLFQGCYSNPKKQGGALFSALLTDAPCFYLGFIRGFLSAKYGHLLYSEITAEKWNYEWFHKWHNCLKKLSLYWIRFSAGENQCIHIRCKHGVG